MSEFLELLKSAEFMRFGTLVALVLFANYKRVWVWGSELREEQAEHKATKANCDRMMADATRTIEKWQDKSLQIAGYAETAIGIKKAQVP